MKENKYQINNSIRANFSRTNKKLFILYSLSFVITSCSFSTTPNLKVNKEKNEIDLGYDTKNSVNLNFNIINNNFNTKAITSSQPGRFEAINHFKIAMSKTVQSPASAIFGAGDAMIFDINVVTNPRPINIRNLKAGSNYYFAARAYSSSDDSVNIVSNDGTPNGIGGGTARTINTETNPEYINVDSSGVISIVQDGTTEILGVNSDDNSQIDIEIQLMKDIGGSITNNTISSTPGLTSIPAYSLIPSLNTKLSAFDANTDSTNIKSLADVSGCNGSTNGGNYIVTWDSDTQDGSGKGVYGQLFNKNDQKIIPSICSLPACNPTTGEFRVNQSTINNQTNSRVSMSDDGSFVVTWQSNHSGDNNIYARRFQSNGNPLAGSDGNEFQVNSSVANEQINPQISHGSDGSFTIIWQTNHLGNYDVCTKKYSNTGTPVIGSDSFISVPSSTDQTFPDVAVNKSSGEILFSWQHDRGDGFDTNARRFTNALIPLGEQFRVNSYPTGNNLTPTSFYNNSTGTNPNDFSITWNKNLPSIYTQYFSTITSKNVDEQKELNQVSSPLSIDSAVDEKNNSIISFISDSGIDRFIKIFSYDYNKKPVLITEKPVFWGTTTNLSSQAKIAYAKDKYVLAFVFKNQVKVKLMYNP
jgi:hypothetical protein